jgi:isopenicillin N synthase-like dioxygenase
MGRTSVSAVPVIDLGPWFNGGEAGRQQVAREVDVALREIGFLLITNHGVDRSLCDAVRSTSREFFELPAAVKERYRSQVGGGSWMPRGWTPLGAEANANSDVGVTAPPDLKESYNIACFAPTGDEAIDREWFTDNIWPGEVPDYRAAVTAYVEKMRALVDELLEIAAVALDLAPRHFLEQAGHPDLVVLHALVPGVARCRRAGSRSASDRLAHRLRDVHDPGPAARHRRTAGARQGRRVGLCAVG